MSRWGYCFTGLLIVVVIYSTLYGHGDICDECGCQSHAIECLMLQYRADVEPTAISATSERLGLVKPHQHRWALIQGSGSGVICALGKGHTIISTARSTQAARWLADTTQFRGSDEARVWLRTSLDVTDSTVLRRWLRVGDFPEAGFDAREEYEAWRAKYEFEWAELAEQHNESGGPQASQQLPSSAGSLSKVRGE